MRSVALAVGAALVLAGCGSGANEEPAPEGTGSGGGAFPRTVAHDMGETEIPSEPRTIVALDQAYVDAAFSLDTPIAGYTTFGGVTELPAYLGGARQTLGAEAQPVGELSEPNLEAIAALQPDLIVSATVRHEQLYDELSGIAPTVFSETIGLPWKDNVRLLAEAVGKEELADRRVAAYEQRARAVGDAIREKLGRNPTVSVLRFVGGGPARLYYESSFIGTVLRDAGLARPPSQDVVDPEEIALEISPERLLDADADHIFVTTYADPSGAGQQDAQRFRSNPLWEQLTGEIHEVDDTVWISSVGLAGAQAILDDLAETFEVDPARG